MITLERAKKEIEQRRKEEQNMFIDMKKEIDNYKKYYQEYKLLKGYYYE